MYQIVEEGLKISWTRDVFGRLPVAEAAIAKHGFMSADRDIRSNYTQAIW